MPEMLTSPLIDAATATFESLAYLFAEPGTVDDLPVAHVDGVVAVPFSGPLHGALMLQLSGGILPALTGNMLGLDDPSTGSDQRDALGEAANVICGNVLPRVAGTAAVFALGVPQVYGSWGEAVAALGTVSVRVRLDIEGGRADIALVLHSSW